jgi:hypothetical protein
MALADLETQEAFLHLKEPLVATAVEIILAAVAAVAELVVQLVIMVQEVKMEVQAVLEQQIA